MMFSLFARRRHVVAILASSLLASCAVGPDFKRPAAPEVGEYTRHPVTTTVATENVAGGEARPGGFGASF
jgi:type IV pilus biogenesis protein CpaD/CtpE